MRSIHQKIRRWLSVTIMVTVVCFIPYIVIFGADSANASLGNLQSSTANQDIANAMSQCLNFAYDRMQENTNSEYDLGDLYNSPEGYNPFASVGDMYINVSYSTGQAITGYLNSSISCGVIDPFNPSASVIDKFAQSVGKTDYMDIVCNGESAGIMKQQYWNGSTWVDSVGQCKTTPGSGTQYRYVWNDERAANSYLNSLYDGDWYSVSDFTPEQNYYRYYAEYLATCVDPKDTSPVNVNAPNIDHSQYGSTIYWYDNNGSLTEIHFKEKDNTKSWGISGLSSGLGGAKSCGELAQLINNQHEAMDDFVLAEKEQAKKDSCVNSISSDKLSALKNEAQGIVTLNRHNPNTVPPEVVKNANRILRNEFWEKDGNGEIVCWIPDSLSTGSSTTTTPPVTIPDPDETEPSIGGNNDNTSSDPSTGPDPCGDGVGSLGWILCPVVNLLSNTVQSFYNNYLQQNFLEVDSSWLGSSTDLYEKGWSQFRNYANIVLTIVLVIVILSQLTGVGVTNYGIKKMLPRIVIMAILINMSFLICQLAVDISNILGYSINKLFVSLSVDFGSSGAAAGGGVGWLNALSITGLGLTALTIGQWIMPLFLALLTSIISVAFAGIILGIRQAGILVLVIISPLAFACYAFDGTQSWFDKWRKLFINLLIVFPVCGLLMGGGVYASNLLASAPSAGIFIKLIAVMLKVVPFFFIPTMVKGALTAIGNIGTKVGALGRGLRGSATKMGRTSDLYQRLDSGAGVLQGKGMRGMKSLIGKGIRKIPGGEKLANHRVGRFIGRFGNRRIARYAQKEYNLAASDATADAIAEGGFLNTERREGMKAAAKEKAEAQGTEEQQALYRTKLGESGVVSDTTLKKEIEKIQEDFDRKPQDVTLRRKLKALTKFLLDFDDGRGELVKQYHKLMSKYPDSASAQILDAFLNRGENMSVVKQSGQRGLQAMIQDRAQGKKIESLAHYAATKAEKPDMNAVGRIDTSFLKSQLKAMQDDKMFGTLTDKDKSDMGDWLQLYQDALSNQHTKGSINLESKNLIQQVTSAAAVRGITPILRT